LAADVEALGRRLHALAEGGDPVGHQLHPPQPVVVGRLDEEGLAEVQGHDRVSPGVRYRDGRQPIGNHNHLEGLGLDLGRAAPPVPEVPGEHAVHPGSPVGPERGVVDIERQGRDPCGIQQRHARERATRPPFEGERRSLRQAQGWRVAPVLVRREPRVGGIRHREDQVAHEERVHGHDAVRLGASSQPVFHAVLDGRRDGAEHVDGPTLGHADLHTPRDVSGGLVRHLHVLPTRRGDLELQIGAPQDLHITGKHHERGEHRVRGGSHRAQETRYRAAHPSGRHGAEDDEDHGDRGQCASPPATPEHHRIAQGAGELRIPLPLQPTGGASDRPARERVRYASGSGAGELEGAPEEPRGQAGRPLDGAGEPGLLEGRLQTCAEADDDAGHEGDEDDDEECGYVTSRTPGVSAHQDPREHHDAAGHRSDPEGCRHAGCTGEVLAYGVHTGLQSGSDGTHEADCPRA
jgi:hypothetical protein